MRSKVKVLSETKTGLNNKVLVDGSVLTNNQAYDKAKKGQIPGYCGVKNENGTKYIRSNPDNSKKNNIG